MEEEVVVPAIIEEKVVKRQMRSLKIHLYLNQNVVERITAVLFIVAILLNVLIRANLAALKTG